MQADSVTGLDIASFVLGVIGTVLGTWSIAEYYLSGPRARVVLKRRVFWMRVHMDPDRPHVKSESFTVTIRSRGRFPISVETWGLEMRPRPWGKAAIDRRAARDDVPGPAPPLRLRSHEGQTFNLPRQELDLWAEEHGWKRVWLRAHAELGSGKTKRSPWWRQIRLDVAG